MFDPTAFDNLKVIIEGHLYDIDLDGEIKIVDRNDVINLAKLSREFSIKFCLKNTSEKIFAILTLQSGLENLAAELLPMSNVPNKQGGFVHLEFVLNHPNKQDLFEMIQKEFQKIWGGSRYIQQTIILDPLKESPIIQNRIMIDFKRMITEDQIDDLTEMVTPILETLSMLESIH